MTVTIAAAAGLFGVGLAAGLTGALVGVGGGILTVPSLIVLFGVDVRVAIASALVCVIATSTAAGSAYVGAGIANMRLGMTLELATTTGGIAGGVLAQYVTPRALMGAFAILLLITSALLLARWRESPGEPRAAEPHQVGWEERGRLAGAFIDNRYGLIRYTAVRVPLGLALSFAAGIASGLLGIGAGFLKVPAMAIGMRVPFKVAAGTTNLMLGVTATASLFVYFASGDVVPAIVVPAALGSSAGALAGTWLSGKLTPSLLRGILGVVLLIVAIQMIRRTVGGGGLAH
jgi:uncharacterized protein